MIKVQNQDPVQMEELQIPAGEVATFTEQASNFQNKLKIYRDKKKKKPNSLPKSSAKRWIFPVVVGLLAVLIVGIFFTGAPINPPQISIELKEKITVHNIENPKKDNGPSSIKQLDNQTRNEQSKPQKPNQQQVQTKKQQPKVEPKNVQQAKKQEIKKQQKPAPKSQSEIVQITQESSQTDKKEAKDNTPSEAARTFSDQYEYDVNGTFNLWDLNPMEKSILFKRYNALPRDRKKENNKYMQINYGKDQQFSAFAETFQANADLIDWFSINLTVQEQAAITKDFQEALKTRRRKIQSLLAKYQQQYKGKKGPINPKKNVTYERFLASLEYQRLTGQKYWKNLQLNKIYQKQKEYYRQTYHTEKPKEEIHSCIVIPTYNNVVDHRYLWNLETILQQEYLNYKLIIIDDASSDQTPKKIAQHLKWRGVAKEKVVLLRNKKRQAALRNTYYGVHKYCDYNQIFYILDGDDEIIGTQVFKFYNVLYQQKKYYVIYSSHFQYQSKNQTHPLLLGLSFAYPEQVKKQNSYRTYAHAYSHLKTSITDLLLLINVKSLQGEDGKFYETISDNALFFPAMEMSCGQVDYTPEMEYWYNADTGINDWRTPDQTTYGRTKRHINFIQKHYQCIHKTIRQMEFLLNLPKY